MSWQRKNWLIVKNGILCENLTIKAWLSSSVTGWKLSYKHCFYNKWFFPSVCTKAIFIIFCQGKSPCHTNSIWMAFVKMFWKLFCNMEDCTASTCTEPGMNSPNMNFQFMQWVEPFVVLKPIKGFCPCKAPFVNFHILTRKASEIEYITMSLQLECHIHFSSACGMAP